MILFISICIAVLVALFLAAFGADMYRGIKKTIDDYNSLNDDDQKPPYNGRGGR